jgi:hypothetical protein
MSPLIFLSYIFLSGARNDDQSRVGSRLDILPTAYSRRNAIIGSTFVALRAGA